MGLPDLDTKCWKCWGTGQIAEDHGISMECDACSGIGRIPTEAGRKILEFLTTHLDIDYQDEDEE